MPTPSSEHPGFAARVRAQYVTIRCKKCGKLAYTTSPEARDAFFQEHRHGVKQLPNGTPLG